MWAVSHSVADTADTLLPDGEVAIIPKTACVTGDKGNTHYAEQLDMAARNSEGTAFMEAFRLFPCKRACPFNWCIDKHKYFLQVIILFSLVTEEWSLKYK